MGKKLTDAFVKVAFEKRGWKLLSKTYVNNRTHLDFECEFGHIYSMRWDRFKQNPSCPVCSGAVLSDLNRLSLTHPHLVAEWDYEKNYPLRPEDVSYASNKKVGWRCKKAGHTWGAVVSSRTNKEKPAGCPSCSGRDVTDETRLSLLYPELCEEWDIEKNHTAWEKDPEHPRTPEEVSCSSGKKVWWKCLVCGYSWPALVANRTREKNPSGCRACAGRAVTDLNRLSLTHPDLCEEWDYAKNQAAWEKDPEHPRTPEEVSYKSSKKSWWKCLVFEHSWLAVIRSRNREKNPAGCPGCSGYAVTDENRLSLTHPKFCKEWDYAKNYVAWEKDPDHPRTPEEVSFGSGTKVWWGCFEGHSWQATVKNRTNKKNPTTCGLCSKGPSSKMSQVWLDGQGVPDILGVTREVKLNVPYADRGFMIVDGFDPETNTVYEFLGDYWHGNPNVFAQNVVHPYGKTFGQLFDETVEKLFALRQHGYNLEIIWEEDFIKL